MRRNLKRAGLALGGAVLVLAAVLVGRTLSLSAEEPATAPAAALQVDAAAAAGRLAEAIRFRTVSHQDPAADDAAAFAGLNAWLARSYPRAAAALPREVIGGHSLLYTWAGAEPSLPPLVLMAHTDVVPIASPQAWTHPPFAGVIADGYVWGRGAMDDKNAVVGLMEAVEALLAEGWAPRRTLLLAFGHDEEVGGQRGAAAIAKRLQAAGVTPWMVLDEGLVVTDGVMPGVARPVALIGVAEKGYLTLQLTAEASGGHSSMPERPTAVGRLAAALHRLSEEPLPPRLDASVEGMLLTVAPHLPFGQRLGMANLWLLEAVVLGQLGNKPSTNALIRTTTAPTVLEGSPKSNVLARRARALVNFRIIPGETVESVTATVRERIADDAIALEAVGDLRGDPVPASPTDGPEYAAVEAALRQVYPEAIVAPGLFIAATDSRHFATLTPKIYRFAPQVMKAEDRPRFHGVDERMSVEGFARAVRFYAQLMRNASEAR